MNKCKPKDEISQKIISKFLHLILDLEIKHYEYRTLFENESLMPLLKKSALSFFTNINNLYVDSLILDIGKITDPIQSGEDENFTISNIIHSIEWSRKSQKRLNKLEKEILLFRRYIKGARNKILAHYDKDTYLENRTLGEYPYEEGEVFFNNLKEVLNICYEECTGKIPTLSTFQKGDVQDLINSLKQSEAFNRIWDNASIEEEQSLLDLLDEVNRDYK